MECTMDGKLLESSFPLTLRKAYENGDEKVVNAVIEILIDTDPNLKFNMKHGMWTTGSKTPFELIQKIQALL